MTGRFKNLKDELKSLEQGEDVNPPAVRRKRNRHSAFSRGVNSPNWLKYLLFGGFLVMFTVYTAVTYTGTGISVDNPFVALQEWVNQPDEELLTGMGSWMEEMGYTGLSREDLIDLRRQGVTATFTSRMRDLGYTELTLDQLVRLRQNDVSSTFAAMMKELGYTLSPDELIELRQHGVTAYFTSNMHDLGYSDITKEELIRLRDVGVQVSDVETLIERNGTPPSVEEMIRYRISNQ